MVETVFQKLDRGAMEALYDKWSAVYVNSRLTRKILHLEGL